jgi:quercetin dioxygenase-like cupin family protein
LLKSRAKALSVNVKRERPAITGVDTDREGPVAMKPGAVIPAHLHKGMAEALYVVEGDFTNEGKQYQAGTSLHFKAGKAHGPQTTKNGCRLLVLWTERSSKESADLSDFTLANQRAA